MMISKCRTAWFIVSRTTSDILWLIPGYISVYPAPPIQDNDGSGWLIYGFLKFHLRFRMYNTIIERRMDNHGMIRAVIRALESIRI